MVRNEDRGWFRSEGLASPDPALPGAASPPIRNADGYYAYLESLPGRFWTRNTPDEIEYACEIQPGRLTNLGTIRRGVKDFTVNANSVRRAADLEAVVLAAASAAGCPADVTRRNRPDRGGAGQYATRSRGRANSREATRRLGIEGVSLPSNGGSSWRGTSCRSSTAWTRSGARSTVSSATSRAGIARQGRNDPRRVGCHRGRRAGPGDCDDRRLRVATPPCGSRRQNTGMLPDPGELRRRLGIPAGSRPIRSR